MFSMFKFPWRMPDLSMLFLALFVAGLVFLQSSWGHLLLADTVFGTVRTELGQAVLAVGGALLKTAMAFLFWILLDRVFQPWLCIRDLFDGSPTVPGSDRVRSAFIHGYFILAAAVVLAVSLGGTP